MSNAGTVYVDVLPDTKNFGRELSGQLAGSDGAFAGIRNAGKAALGDIITLAGQASALMVGGLGAAVLAVGVSYNTLEQTSRAAFKTILGSADAANTMMQQLHDFAMTSPFPRQAFIEATQELLAFGYTADQIIPTLQAIQDTVAATGGNATDIGVLADLLAKVRSSATLGVEDLNQFALHGVNVAQILGGAMGMTEQQFRDSIYGAPLKGQAAIDALDLLIPGLEAKFSGAAAGVKLTWVGAVDRIKGAFRDLSSEVLDPFISKTGGGAGVKWANDIADALRSIEKSTGFKNLLGDITAFTDRVAPKVDSFFTGLVTKINSADLGSLSDKFKGLGTTINGLEPLLAGAGAGFAAFSLNSIPYIGALVPPWLPVVAAVAGFVLKSKEGRDALSEIGAAAKDAGQILGPAIADSLKIVLPDLELFVGAIGDTAATLLPALARVAATAGPAFAQTLGAALQIAAPLMTAFADAVAEIPGPLLDIIGVVGGTAFAVGKIGGLFGGLLGVLTGGGAGGAAAQGGGLLNAIGGTGLLGLLGRLPAAFGPWGVAIAAAGVGVGILATATPLGTQKVEEFTESAKLQSKWVSIAAASTDGLTGSINGLLSGLLRKSQVGEFNTGLADMGVTMQDVIDHAARGPESFGAWVGSLHAGSSEAGLAKEKLGEMEFALGRIGSRDLLGGVSNQAAALGNVKTAAGLAYTGLLNLADVGAREVDVAGAMEQKHSLLADATQRFANAGLNAALAYEKQTGDGAGAAEMLNGYKKNLIDTLVQMGLSQTAAENYADKLLGIPKLIESQVHLKDGDTALATLSKLKDEYPELGAQIDLAVGKIAYKQELEEKNALVAITHLKDEQAQYGNLAGSIEPYIGAVLSATARNTEHGLVAFQTLDSIAQKYPELGLAVVGYEVKLIETIGTDTAHRAQSIGTLEAIKEKYPQLSSLIDGYITALHKIPGEINTKHKLLEDAVYNYATVLEHQGRIHDIDVYVNVHERILQDPNAADGTKGKGLGVLIGNANKPGGTAAEGALVPAQPGGSLWRVGEAGHAEIIVPTNDEDRAKALLRAGGLGNLLADSLSALDASGIKSTSGDTFTFNVTVHGSDPAAAAEAGRQFGSTAADIIARRRAVHAVKAT